MRRKLALVLSGVLVAACFGPAVQPAVSGEVPQSNTIIQDLAEETGAFTAEATMNPLDISAEKLAETDILLWNSTTGKAPFSAEQRDAILQWISCGGGTIGIHAAADSHYAWPEYAELMGGQFDGHPHGENGGIVKLNVEHRKHTVNRAYSKAAGDKKFFKLDDEYYNWRITPRRIKGLKVMVALDHRSVSDDIQGGTNAYEPLQPLAWTYKFRGTGRIYYTNLGHGTNSWHFEPFQKTVVRAVKWVSQVRPDQDCLASEDSSIPPSPLRPPTVDPSTPVDACDVPEEGPPGNGATNPPARLTEDGDSLTMPGAGVPGGLGWSRQPYVLDLSGSGAHTADVTMDLTWPAPTDDYDLSVTTDWGWAGSDALSGAEQVVLEDVPHCADLLVFAENSVAVSQQAPELAVTVAPKE
jgi:type 1 glutamine amidotransferase